MNRTLAQDLPKQIGSHVRVRGYLHALRLMGKMGFLVLRDRSGLVQVVIEDKQTLSELKRIHIGSILCVTGTATGSQVAELGCEITSACVMIEERVTEAPPIEYYKPSIPSDLEHILDNRTLSLRNRQVQAVFKIQAELAHALRLYMHDEIGAIEYFAPNIVGSSSEGGAEFFNVDYFGYNASLAQSSQLYKQIMVGVNERVFAIMPFFRAEPSHTPRHLCEGKQFEFEMGFFEHWHELLDIQETLIKKALAHIKSRCQNELELLGQPLIEAPESVPFPRISFKEALELYFQRSGLDERHENDLSPGAERELCKWAKETCGTDFVFVTNYLSSKRPFYSQPNERDPSITNTFDLLCAGTEITSGGQRRNSYNSMLEGLKSKSMNPKDFEDYLSIFKYGMPVHGGFGMGLERLTMTLLQLRNIREASLFPSDPKRIAGVKLKAHIFFGDINLRNEIIRLLKDRHIEHKHLTHEPTPTSEDSAKVRGMSLASGVKSLILKGKSSKKNYQFNIPADARLDMKVAGELVGEKCEFEDPAVIKERYGLDIGAIPPFGNLLNLDIYYDSALEKADICAFNCGLLTESIIMKPDDLIALTKPKLAPLIKIT